MEQYKEKLKEAKKLYESANNDQKHVLESLFPELKESESEDEKIRKDIIDHLQFLAKYCIESMPNVDKWIAWLEKQGNNLVKNGYTKNKDYIRYADRYSYEIWRKLMDNFKNIKDYHIGCNEVSDIVLNAIIDTFNWLEKGGDKNKVSKHVEAINEEKIDDANKVEPKDYNSEDMIREWTINDAKDGDVLVTVYDKRPLIYKGCLDPNHPDSPVAYCGIDSEGYFICSCVDKFNHWWTDEKVQPATKEQRDLLFQKMKEAGYEWDEKKKELKKIKMLPTKWSEEAPTKYE